MAELMLKIGTRGPDPDWQDGDIMCAFNDIYISHKHVQHICGRLNLTEAKTWIDPVMAETYLATKYQYKTQRISRTEIDVTDQWTNETIRKSDVPNAYGHIIDVELFFQRRLANTPYLVFGSPGLEVYYHGRSRYEVADDTKLWQTIESRTPNLKANHNLWPAGSEELRHFLYLSVDDFDNDMRFQLESPVYQEVADENVMLKRRRNDVKWRDIGLSAKNKEDIENMEKGVDIRYLQFTRSLIVQDKNLIVR